HHGDAQRSNSGNEWRAIIGDPGGAADTFSQFHRRHKLQEADLREDGISGVCRSTCPRCRQHVQVDNFPIAYLATKLQALGQRVTRRFVTNQGASLTGSEFTGTDRGLLRSVLGTRSPVPKCEAPGAPISVEEHTSMAPRPRPKVRILRFKNLPPFWLYHGLQNHV